MADLLPTEYPSPLIVLDLEWNQRYGRLQGVANTLPQEIVEIGAVKMDAQGCIVDRFCQTIRPVVHPVLHRHVQRVTGISEADCRAGGTFTEACAALMAFCGTSFTLCTWGPDDYPVLQRNLAYWMQPQEWLRCPVDAQRVYAMVCPAQGKAKQTSLHAAMEALGVEQELPPHRALHDAYHTALVIRLLLEGIHALPPEDPRQSALSAMRAEYLSRRHARCEVRPTQRRTAEALLADEEALSLDCPSCGKRLFSAPNLRLYASARQTLEQLSRCPEHGPVWARYVLQRTLEGTLSLHVSRERATEEQANRFTERCALQTAQRRGRPRSRRAQRQQVKRGAEQPT